MGVTASPSQANAFMITERVTSIFSLLGIFFILSTFLLSRGFDKPINRLIFFASWSNLGMNIASLIAQDGVAAGQNSSLCQFQAWAIQMFLGVDVFWALCMAFNVYLALFRGWTASRMRAQEWKYFVGCYGASFLPAVIYLGIQTQSRGRVYGPALVRFPSLSPLPTPPSQQRTILTCVDCTALVLGLTPMGFPPRRDPLRHSLDRHPFRLLHLHLSLYKSVCGNDTNCTGYSTPSTKIPSHTPQ